MVSVMSLMQVSGYMMDIFYNSMLYLSGKKKKRICDRCSSSTIITEQQINV